MRKAFCNIGALIGFGCVCLANIEAQDTNGTAPSNGAASVVKPGNVDAPDAKLEGGTSDWTARARRILEIGSEARSSAGQKTKAYQEWTALKPTADEDPRLIFAFVLVAMAEKQWPSAQRHSSELLKSHPDYVPARVANARLLLLLDQKPPAIAELESLAKSLALPSSIVTSDQLVSAAAFLGLAVGYFEGPGKESIKATMLKELVAVANKIPQPLSEPFERARSVIGNEYRVLVEEGELALKELRDGLTRNAEQLRAELESQREKTRDDTESAKRRLESNWAQSKAAWDAAWSRCQALSQSATSLQLQHAQHTTSLSLLRPPRVDSKGNIDPNDDRRYRSERRRLENLILNLDNQINQLSIQYNLASQNGMLAENQMNALRTQAQRLGMSLAAQNGSFAKMDQMIRSKEKQAQKAKPTLSGTKLRHARSFNTYDDFNFYKEQSLLVDALPRE